MATIRIKFRASATGAGEGTLFFQIIHARVARQISTGVNFQKWAQFNVSTAASMAFLYTTYKIGDYDSIASDQMTIIAMVPVLSVNEGDSLFVYHANDNGSASADGKVYDSQGMDANTQAPTGNPANGLYQVKQVTKVLSQYVTVGTNQVSCTQYAFILAHYTQGVQDWHLSGSVYVPDSTSNYITFALGYGMNLTVTANAGSTAETTNTYTIMSGNYVCTDKNVTWQDVVDDPTGYGFTLDN